MHLLSPKNKRSNIGSIEKSIDELLLFFMLLLFFTKNGQLAVKKHTSHHFARVGTRTLSSHIQGKEISEVLGYTVPKQLFL